jgi:hypothetical protein
MPRVIPIINRRHAFIPVSRKKEKAFTAVAINALSPYPVEFFDTHT